MSNKKIAAIVPAAGLGTRMKSATPKFLHKVCGKSIISHIILSLENCVDEIVVVVGNGKEKVQNEIETQCSSFINRISFVEQSELLGSGHATKIGMTKVSTNVENIIVVLGDMPLINESLLNKMIDSFKKSEAHVLVSTAVMEQPFGYGRILRDENKIITRIVEEKDCDEKLKTINECNMYPFIFTKDFLEFALDKLDTNNAQGEQYLTDTVQIARDSSKGVSSFTYEDERFAKGANDRMQLSELEKIMREEINKNHMENGVTIIDPVTTYIDSDVVIENDVTILPGSYLQGKTTIKTGSIIGPNSRIIDSVIGQNCIIETSTIKESEIRNNVTVGPYSSLRPGTLLEDDVHVGTFVEMKKTTIGKGSKVPHLSYLGDAVVGQGTNLGAGTTTANYDGKNKHQTKIGNNVKTGVNTVLVAPVEVGDGAYTGAGAVVVKDVPAGSLAKGVPATNDDDWIAPTDR